MTRFFFEIVVFWRRPGDACRTGSRNVIYSHENPKSCGVPFNGHVEPQLCDATNQVLSEALFVCMLEVICA